MWSQLEGMQMASGDRSCGKRTLRWSLMAMTAAITSMVTWFATRASVGLAPGLLVAPSVTRVDDHVYKEGEVVRASFKVSNPTGRPIRVKAYRTSCSCMATTPEGGTPPPFVLKPGGLAEFTLRTSALATRGLEQSYSAHIESEVDGKDLPPAVASVHFRVEDGLRAVPRELVIGDAPMGEPVRRTVMLYTKSDAADEATFEFGSSDGQSIAVDASKATGPSESLPGFTPRYKIEVAITPGSDPSLAIGTIEVRRNREVALLIPVRCSFRQDYRLSRPNGVDIEGKPGQIITRQVFYESSSPGWRDLSVVSRPEGVEITIQPFDARTQVIRIRATVPEVAPPQPDPRVVLAAGEHKAPLEIPLRYTRGE